MSNSPAGHVSWPDRYDDAPLSSSSERRKHTRKKLAFLTAVLLDPGSNSPATVVDLSEGGVGVRSGLPLQQGAICRLQLSAPASNQVIDAACELAWNRAPHAGFRFSILTEKSQRQIKEWLSLLDEVRGKAAAATADAGSESSLGARESALRAVPQSLELAAITDQALLSFVLQARDLTKADGAAVAINDGTGIICRASLGSAPDVGVRLTPDRGLSGECLRTGEIVVCYDAESDPRVDPAVSRQLNMRSAVIVPIGRHDTPAGLMEVFFAAPRAFDEGAVYALQELATAFLVASEAAPAPVIPQTESSRAPSLPQMASFSQRQATPGFVICDVCGEENNESNRVCEKCDVPLPAALRYVDLNSPDEGENSGFRAHPGRTEQPQPSHRGSYRKKLLLVLLAAALLGTWQMRGRLAAEPILIPLPKMFIEVPALQDKAAEAPLQKAVSTKPSASRKSEPEKKTVSKKAGPTEPTEPEVVVRTFPAAAKAPAKAGDKKQSSEKKSTLTSTIPDAVDLTQAGATPLRPAEQAEALPLADAAAEKD